MACLSLNRYILFKQIHYGMSQFKQIHYGMSQFKQVYFV
jgi:hypothetical protein